MKYAKAYGQFYHRAACGSLPETENPASLKDIRPFNWQSVAVIALTYKVACLTLSQGERDFLSNKIKHGDQLSLEGARRIRKDDTVIVTATDARTVKALCRVS